MSFNEIKKTLRETCFMHVYELTHRDGNFQVTHWHQPAENINKIYWLLGDRKALEEFREQYHHPYTGYTHI